MRRFDFAQLIIFEDDDYLVINKPAGISTLEDRKTESHLLAMAKDLYSDIQVCHRIDKDTSGILVFAKNQASYKHLALQFQNRKVVKIYHAIVHGQTHFEKQLVDVPLIVKTHGKVRWDKRKGKESATYFHTLQNFQSNSLVECTPVTGRKHQIRVHLNALSCSIVADTMYGGQPIYLSEIKRKYKLGNKEEPQMISRMALHAKQISFLGNDNSLKTIESDYTKDFKILLKQLNKYASI